MLLCFPHSCLLCLGGAHIKIIHYPPSDLALKMPPCHNPWNQPDKCLSTNMLWPLLTTLSHIFTVFVLLHLSTSISSLLGLCARCGREPTLVHPNAPQQERPLHNSRQWDGDTPCKRLEGKVASTFFSQGLDDLLSMSLANSDLVHVPRVFRG